MPNEMTVKKLYDTLSILIKKGFGDAMVLCTKYNDTEDMVRACSIVAGTAQNSAIEEQKIKIPGCEVIDFSEKFIFISSEQGESLSKKEIYMS